MNFVIYGRWSLEERKRCEMNKSGGVISHQRKRLEVSVTHTYELPNSGVHEVHLITTLSVKINEQFIFCQVKTKQKLLVEPIQESRQKYVTPSITWNERE